MFRTAIPSAFRAFLVEGRPSREVARAFGYSLNSFYVLCHHFRREPAPVFFVSPRRSPQSQPKKSAAHDWIVQLRKQNHSVNEISQTLKDRHCPLSPTAVREVLRAEGFAALPRRLDEERPHPPGPTVEPVADVRQFSLAPRQFTTDYGGLFLFIADLVRLGASRLAHAAGLPGSKLIPAEHALRACLALKLWSIERKSHVMSLVADVPTRKYRTPRVYEQTVVPAGRSFRQMFIQDLGHEDPTILITNQRHTQAKALVTRYAQRMLIENALSDAVRFFHIDALSSAVGLKVDFDMALLVLASGLYRLVAQRMRGYGDAQARQIFRDLIDMPADVEFCFVEIQAR